MTDEPQEQEVVEAAVATADPDPEEFRPPGHELVVADRSDPQAPFRAMDRHDEAQILDELMGRALDVMLYSFVQGGKRLTDLSYAGVQECVRTLNARGASRIRVAAEPAPLFAEVTDDGETYIQATAYAEDTLNGGGAWGTATEPKYMKLKGGKTKLDSFARTKALSKAQRNAEKALIPEEFRQMLIAMYLKDETRVKHIKAGPGAAAESDLPPPLATPEAEERKARARAVYDEIRAVNPLALLPGQFHMRFMRASSSIEALDSFIEALEAKRDELREAA